MFHCLSKVLCQIPCRSHLFSWWRAYSYAVEFSATSNIWNSAVEIMQTSVCFCNVHDQAISTPTLDVKRQFRRGRAYNSLFLLVLLKIVCCIFPAKKEGFWSHVLRVPTTRRSSCPRTLLSRCPNSFFRARKSHTATNIGFKSVVSSQCRAHHESASRRPTGRSKSRTCP